jgi:hypothetical protein
MLSLAPLESQKFSTHFLLYPFFKNDDILRNVITKKGVENF